MIGKVVDRSYHLQYQLGEGGMGAVYRARHLVSGNHVALKLVTVGAPHQGQTTDSSSLRLALAREFQTLASLHHPNVIRVLSYGFDDELGPYFTMELLDSPKTLLQAAAERGLDGKVQLVAQLLRALAYVHQRGILHRDIKPSNVLVVRDEVKLLDFGIASAIAKATELAGTLDYMAPELLLGQPASVASDLYSTGVLFYQALSGTFPHSRESLTRMLQGLLGEDSDYTFSPEVAQLLEHYRRSSSAEHSGVPTLSQGVQSELADQRVELWLLPEIPEGIQETVRRLLARHPGGRYADARAVLSSLACAVNFPLPAETVATRESFLQGTALVGRDAELKALMDALKKAKAGEGAGFLIGGESGIGKSRLLSELRTQALVNGLWLAEGQSVLEGGAYYQEWLPLLRALCLRSEVDESAASVLKRLLPEVEGLLSRPVPDAEILSPEEMQVRLADTLVQLLGKVQKPVLIIQEDLHWARSESAWLLGKLAGELRNLPVLLVGTYRSDENPNLPQALPTMAVMALQRLTTGGIAQLTASILGRTEIPTELVRFLEQQTDGNAFFLVEVVRALAERAGELQRILDGTLPESVLTSGIERILEQRLERIPKGLWGMLEFSATLGRKLDLRVLERTFAEVDLEEALITCANAAILESQACDWRFAHDKLREALLRNIAPEGRRQLHRQVAESLEIVYEGEARQGMSATLAFHLDQASLYEKAVEYFLLAEKDAARLSLSPVQRAHLAAAIASLQQVPDTPERRRTHVDILLALIRVGMGLVGRSAQLEHIEKARALLESLAISDAAAPADRLRLAHLDHHCGRVYQHLGRAKEAIFYHQRALSIAKELDDLELRIMPSIRIGLSLCYQGEFGKAMECLEPIAQKFIREDSKHNYSIRGILYSSFALAGAGHGAQALARLERLSDALKQMTPEERGVYTGIKFLMCITMADWPGAIEAAERTMEIGDLRKEPIVGIAALDAVAWAQSYLGEPEQAIEIGARTAAARQSVNGGFLPDWFEAGRAEILLNGGRAEEAIRQAEKAVALGRESENVFCQAIAERAWGCALGRLGSNPAEVAVHFETSLEISRSADQVITAALTELWWGRILREYGDVAEAQRRFDRAITQMQAGGYQYALSQARRFVMQS